MIFALTSHTLKSVHVVQRADEENLHPKGNFMVFSDLEDQLSLQCENDFMYLTIKCLLLFLLPFIIIIIVSRNKNCKANVHHHPHHHQNTSNDEYDMNITCTLVHNNKDHCIVFLQ